MRGPVDRAFWRGLKLLRGISTAGRGCACRPSGLGFALILRSWVFGITPVLVKGGACLLAQAVAETLLGTLARGLVCGATPASATASPTGSLRGDFR